MPEARLGPLATFAESDWRDLFRVNVDGVFFCCQAVLPAMIARRRGNIVTIASWNGKLGAPNFPGDTMKMSGVVKTKQESAGTVDLEVVGKNSWGNHVTAKVCVALPKEA